MQIFLQTMAGKMISLSIEPSETIKSAKARVQEAEGLIASQQQWVWCGEKLSDRLRFEDYEIQADSTIDLILSKQKIQISIRTFDGNFLRLETESCSSVEDLKAQIEEASPGCFKDVAPEYRAWVFQGKSLEDGRHLSDYGIDSGSTVWLAARKTARGARSEASAEPPD
ncbi:UBB [Symbiodinium sp. CCMP2592]|nr:UBB [Symbiodinium sp. CCMP2592]